MGKYLTRRAVKKIVNNFSDGIYTEGIPEFRLLYDVPLLKLRTKESVLKYLYEVSANSLKAELAKQGRYKLNMDEIEPRFASTLTELLRGITNPATV